jgi:hypothetical protein
MAPLSLSIFVLLACGRGWGREESMRRTPSLSLDFGADISGGESTLKDEHASAGDD